MNKGHDIEALSALVHEAWMVEQQKRGRTTRRSQSGEEFMVPYDALSEEAKEFDRATVRAVLNALEQQELDGPCLEPRQQ